jgi:hypothetical protein
LSSCGVDFVSPESGSNGFSPYRNRHTVVIEDDGFDIDHPVYAQNIIKTIQVTCTETPEKIQSHKFASYDLFKQAAIASMKAEQKNHSCQYNEINKAKFISPLFNQIASQVQNWNQFILNGLGNIFSLQKPEGITNILEGEQGEYSYHGTAVAAYVAHKNPNVQLILIQKKGRRPDSGPHRLGHKAYA